MIKIGLTGGIGSGKSMISKCFSTLGIPIYNSDIEAKKLLNRNHSVQEQLLSAELHLAEPGPGAGKC